METSTFFQMVEALIVRNATYSETTGRRTLPLQSLRVIYTQRTEPQPLELLKLRDAVEEGVRKGYWEMEYDDTSDTDIVVLL